MIHILGLKFLTTSIVFISTGLFIKNTFSLGDYQGSIKNNKNQDFKPFVSDNFSLVNHSPFNLKNNKNHNFYKKIESNSVDGSELKISYLSDDKVTWLPKDFRNFNSFAFEKNQFINLLKEKVDVLLSLSYSLEFYENSFEYYVWEEIKNKEINIFNEINLNKFLENSYGYQKILSIFVAGEIYDFFVIYKVEKDQVVFSIVLKNLDLIFNLKNDYLNVNLYFLEKNLLKNSSGKNSSLMSAEHNAQEFFVDKGAVDNPTPSKERNSLDKFELGGWYKSNGGGTQDERKYYIKDGKDSHYGHLLAPHLYLNNPNAFKQKIKNIFTSTLINTDKVGGMILDKVDNRKTILNTNPDPDTPTKNCYNSWRLCDDERDKQDKRRCKVCTTPVKESNTKEFINIEKNNPKDFTFKLTRLWVKKDAHIPYDIPPQINKINPELAKLLIDKETREKVDFYGKFPNSTFETPTLYDTILQSIYENKDKDINSFKEDTAKSEQAEFEKTLSNLNNQPLFPAFFVRTADFRSIKYQPQNYDYHNSQDRNLKSNHEINFVINKNAWQKSLIKNEVFGTGSIPASTDKKLATGLTMNIPFNFNINNPYFSENGKLSHNFMIDLKLSDFKNSNIKQGKEEISIPTKLLKSKDVIGNITLNYKIVLNTNFDFEIQLNIGINSFININRSEACDSRDMDTFIDVIFEDGKQIMYYCPCASKIPAFLSVEIVAAPEVESYWYKDDDANIPQKEIFITNVSDRKIQEKISNDILHRQSKQILDLNPQFETKPEYISAWFLGSSTDYLSKVGINTDHKDFSSKPEDWVEIKIIDSNENQEIKFKISSVNDHLLPMFIKSKHVLATNYSLYTNVDNDSDNNKTSGIDEYKYKNELLDISLDDLKPYVADVDFTIKNLNTISSDSSKPTWIPFRSSIAYNNKFQMKDENPKTENNIKDDISKIMNYVMRKDVLFKDESQIKNKVSKINSWGSSDSELKKIKAKKMSVSAVSMGFWIYQTKDKEKNTKIFYLKTQMYGFSMSSALNTNSNPNNTQGSEGKIAFQISNLKIATKTENSKTKK